MGPCPISPFLDMGHFVAGHCVFPEVTWFRSLRRKIWSPNAQPSKIFEGENRCNPYSIHEAKSGDPGFHNNDLDGLLRSLSGPCAVWRGRRRRGCLRFQPLDRKPWRFGRGHGIGHEKLHVTPARKVRLAAIDGVNLRPGTLAAASQFSQLCDASSHSGTLFAKKITRDMN